MGTRSLLRNSTDVGEVFVARQPILDRLGRASAYELLFRNANVEAAQINDDLLCTAAVVERVFGSIGIESLLEGKDAFLNCSAEFIYSDFVDVLPAERFVLEILESCELTPRLADRCAVLRERGFRIALDDLRTITPTIRDFSRVVDIVKLDWPFISMDDMNAIVSEYQCAGKIVLAEKIETREDCRVALELGCDLLQGYYFAKPAITAARKSMPSVASVLRVFDLISHEAPQTLIAEALKDMPILIAQLLRLANNSNQSRGQNARVSSINQALAMAGSKRLLQWCCLLLYANPDGLPVEEDPLALLAERRAVFMSKAASAVSVDNKLLQDSAFLTGMLSLLPIAYGMNEAAFLCGIGVSDQIKKAILGREGMLGDLLTAAEHLERAAPSEALNCLSVNTKEEKICLENFHYY